MNEALASAIRRSVKVDAQPAAGSLTDRRFWQQYWANKDVRVEIGPRYLFHKWFHRFADDRPIRSSIEIGGFPGYFSIFLAKHLNIEPTLLDFYIDREKVRELAAVNQVPLDRLTLIEHDFLSFATDKRYDLVFSCGLIEHFEDYEDLIARHVNLLAPGGRLFIEVPNFRGLNGWVQSWWDAENLAKHNLECMDPQRLRSILADHQLDHIEAGYSGRYGIWLEQLEAQPRRVQRMYRSLHFASRKASRLVPLETRFFSPYIVITGTRAHGRPSACDVRTAA